MIPTLMDRLERLLSLVHVLQSSARPVSMDDLRSQFSDYGNGTHEASRRKIERDKAELAKIGLVIRYTDETDTACAGYTLDEDASYLPAFKLDDQDRGLLAAAASAALRDPHFPHRKALRLALAKLASERATMPSVILAHPTTEQVPTSGKVEQLQHAIAHRKSVRFLYQKPYGVPEERNLDPYGLFLKRGSWYVCGHNTERNSVRVFRVSRIHQADVNPTQPSHPDFNVPDSFRLRQYTTSDPLQYKVNEPIEAIVRVDLDIAFLVARQWKSEPDRKGIFRIRTTHLAYLIDQVLALGPQAELLSPPEARETIRHTLRDVLQAHECSDGEQP